MGWRHLGGVAEECSVFQSQQLQEALAQVIKEEGITLLLRSESVISASPNNRITAKVVDRLNQLTDAKE